MEIKFYGAFVLILRVNLHAIDATPARWRGDAGSSPLDGARAPASSKNCRVHTGFGSKYPEISPGSVQSEGNRRNDEEYLKAQYLQRAARIFLCLGCQRGMLAKDLHHISAEPRVITKIQSLKENLEGGLHEKKSGFPEQERCQYNLAARKGTHKLQGTASGR